MRRVLICAHRTDRPAAQIDVGTNGSAPGPGVKLGLQVAVCYREEDHCWGLPGKFVTSLQESARGLLTEERLSVRAELEVGAVREVFERSLFSAADARAISSEMDELFRKSALKGGGVNKWCLYARLGAPPLVGY